MKKQLLFILLALITVTAAGCLENKVKSRYSFVPNMRYYVGGGFHVEYKAPSDGTAYLIEYNTRKLILTQSLDKHEPFEFSIDPSDKDDCQRLENMGLDIKSLDLKLFFIPLQNPEE